MQGSSFHWLSSLNLENIFSNSSSRHHRIVYQKGRHYQENDIIQLKLQILRRFFLCLNLLLVLFCSQSFSQSQTTSQSWTLTNLVFLSLDLLSFYLNIVFFDRCLLLWYSRNDLWFWLMNTALHDDMNFRLLHAITVGLVF